MKRVLLTMFAAAMFICLFSSAAVAAESPTLDIDKGDIILSFNGTDLTYQQGTGGTESYTGTMTIIYGGSQSGYTISVTSGRHAIKLNNVVINLDDSSQSPNGCPFSISDGAAVNLTLVGNNFLSTTVQDNAGLNVPDGASLTIEESDGSLTATGNEIGAGIGSGGGRVCGTVTINGGTVNATGGAGIGGVGIMVTINDGTVVATGGTDGGAGIGGTVRINGGSVKASSIQPPPTEENVTIPVFLTTLTLEGAGAGTSIAGLDAKLGNNDYTYGMTGVKTITDGSAQLLYLYLPEGTTVTGVTTGGSPRGKYVSAQPITVAANHSNTGTLSPAYGDFDVVDGDGNIPDSSAVSFANGVLSVNAAGEYTISMRRGTTTTSDRIMVNPSGTATVNLNGVSIDAPDGFDQTHALHILSGDVTIKVTADSRLVGGDGGNAFNMVGGGNGVYNESASDLSIELSANLELTGGGGKRYSNQVGTAGCGIECESSGFTYPSVTIKGTGTLTATGGSGDGSPYNGILAKKLHNRRRRRYNGYRRRWQKWFWGLYLSGRRAPSLRRQQQHQYTGQDRGK